MVKFIMKKLMVLFLVILLIVSFSVKAFSENAFQISIFSVLHNKSGEITVILNTSEISGSEDISVVLTDSKGSMDAEDIIYINQMGISQNGYFGVVLPVDESKISEAEYYTLRIGFRNRSSYIQKTFSGILRNTVNEFIKGQPDETSALFLSKFNNFNSAGLFDSEGAVFEGNIKNGLKFNCTLNNIYFDYTVIIAGDCNGDNTISAGDALLALQQSVNKITLSDTAFFAGDVNNNGNIEASDALMILQYSVNKISVL